MVCEWTTVMLEEGRATVVQYSKVPKQGFSSVPWPVLHYLQVEIVLKI